jgi:hypothetical protein
MDAHFRDALANGFTIAEIAKDCASEAGQNARFAFQVCQPGKPGIEIR